LLVRHSTEFTIHRVYAAPDCVDSSDAGVRGDMTQG